MADMEAWEWALLGFAAFFALAILGRMMGGRRDELMTQLKRELEQERIRKQRAEEIKRLQGKQNKPAASQAPNPPAKKSA